MNSIDNWVDNSAAHRIEIKPTANFKTLRRCLFNLPIGEMINLKNNFVFKYSLKVKMPSFVKGHEYDSIVKQYYNKIKIVDFIDNIFITVNNLRLIDNHEHRDRRNHNFINCDYAVHDDSYFIVKCLDHLNLMGDLKQFDDVINFTIDIRFKNLVLPNKCEVEICDESLFYKSEKERLPKPYSIIKNREQFMNSLLIVDAVELKYKSPIYVVYSNEIYDVYLSKPADPSIIFNDFEYTFKNRTLQYYVTIKKINREYELDNIFPIHLSLKLNYTYNSYLKLSKGLGSVITCVNESDLKELEDQVNI